MNTKTGRMILDRETLCSMLRAALSSGEYRFARQTALAWLAAFPGDLEVSLLQARSMLAAGQTELALKSLDDLVRKDPEYRAAYELMALTSRDLHPSRARLSLTSLYALGGRTPAQADLLPWGGTLRAALQMLTEKNWAEAAPLVQEALRAAPDSLLAAVLHLRFVRNTQDTLSLFRLAQLYRSRWPDCLPINLYWAETQMELAYEPEAVRLLHECVAADAAGQVARRLWGENHPYRSLWPEEMVILFDQPVPAAVTVQLGWNQLEAGSIQPTGVLESSPQPEQASSPANLQDSSNPVEPRYPVAPLADWAQSRLEPINLGPSTADPAETQVEASAATAKQVVESQPIQKNEAPAPLPVEQPVSINNEELEQLARKLRRPSLTRADGRFPVYVIFSTRLGLSKQYGPQTTTVLDAEFRKLAGLIRKRPGWDALVFYPDDPVCAAQFGLTPLTERDPWKLKLALRDLDQALARRGEMIGALLIVGGEPVVPFHCLPNPTDDMDDKVLSDNPYGTLDSNYFVTDWPVGRLPGEAGPDAGLLLEQLRAVQRFHVRAAVNSSSFSGWLWLVSFWDRLRRPKQAHSLGYTAAVWRRSSLAVFRPIGAPHTLLASPPESSGSFDPGRILSAGLGYYNLHGLEDFPAWYGQYDPVEHLATDGKAQSEPAPDYPVALTPSDLRRNGHAPRVIFSEACYGGHTLGKTESQSLVLKFLSVGALAVVASTGIAYGSVNTPLIAADLLGNYFWQHLKSGRTVGDALSQARLDLNS